MEKERIFSNTKLLKPHGLGKSPNRLLAKRRPGRQRPELFTSLATE